MYYTLQLPALPGLPSTAHALFQCSSTLLALPWYPSTSRYPTRSANVALPQKGAGLSVQPWDPRTAQRLAVAGWAPRCIFIFISLCIGLQNSPTARSFRLASWQRLAAGNAGGPIAKRHRWPAAASTWLEPSFALVRARAAWRLCAQCSVALLALAQTSHCAHCYN